MKAVCDTNVLISAFLTEGLCWKILLRANRKEFDLFVSPYILSEFQETLSHKLKFPPQSVKEALSLINEVSTMTNIEDENQVPAGTCRDPKDDPVLASAVAAGVDFLVTGDSDLLSLHSYKDVKVVKPRAFEVLFTKRGPR